MCHTIAVFVFPFHSLIPLAYYPPPSQMLPFRFVVVTCICVVCDVGIHPDPFIDHAIRLLYHIPPSFINSSTTQVATTTIEMVAAMVMYSV
jgi:hypothetical protein